MHAHPLPSSKWVPGGNTGEIEAARKGTGHPTSYRVGSGYFSSLIYTLLRTKVYGTNCTFFTSSSSICLFMNEGWPLSGHERVTEARLLLRFLV